MGIHSRCTEFARPFLFRTFHRLTASAPQSARKLRSISRRQGCTRAAYATLLFNLPAIFPKRETFPNHYYFNDFRE